MLPIMIELSKDLNARIESAQKKLVQCEQLTPTDEHILEAVSVIMELEQRAENAEAAVREIQDSMRKLEVFIHRLVER